MEWITLYLVIFICLALCIFVGRSSHKSILGVLNKYYDHPTNGNLTASELGEKLLELAEIEDVEVVKVGGKLTNSFSPKHKVIKLSPANFDSNSVTALGISIHEVGHALCPKTAKLLYTFRFCICHILNFFSIIFIPLILLGSILAFTLGLEIVGFWIIISACIAFVTCLSLTILILPFERQSTKKAINLLISSEIFTDAELEFLKLVLKSINKTYVTIYLCSLFKFFGLLDYEKIMEPSSEKE